MKEFNNNFNKLLENYAPLRTQSRLFYPRNLKLSEEFIGQIIITFFEQ